MKNKKNREVDLSRKSTLFFQLGLILSLLVVWQLIEWKAESKEMEQRRTVYVDQLEEEEIPVTVIEEVKPPEPPQQLTDEVEVIKDDLNKEETEIAPTEVDEDAIVEVADVVVADEEEPIEDYNIMSVEEVPVFPGCEGADDNEARRKCFSEKVNRIVNRTFDSEVGSELGLSGLYRIYVSFRIEKDGSVNIIGARGPHPKLEHEAIRVINTFPEMIPGKQGGRPVGVTYSLPITLRMTN